jgi:threonine dehydrogenase-like Zn-dependent dehydrogenase
MYAAGDVRVQDVPDPAIVEPTNAIMRVTRACICGSDLWPYASMEHSETGQSMGHEAIGVVEDVGSQVAKVGPGKRAAVVGDGAVGLCAVIAAKRLGAEQIIIRGRHDDRIALARDFGATDVVSERGEEAIEHVRELTGGEGVHSVLECVGNGPSVDTAIGIPRPGGAVGRVGVPQRTEIPGSRPAFFGNITISGGPAPVRAYLDKLLPDVLAGHIEPGRVFDRNVGLDGVPDGYRAMADREAIKVMVTP